MSLPRHAVERWVAVSREGQAEMGRWLVENAGSPYAAAVTAARTAMAQQEALVGRIITMMQRDELQSKVAELQAEIAALNAEIGNGGGGRP